MINDKRNYVVFGATGTIASALSAKLRDQGHQLFLTVELAKRRITVNCVAPGFVETQMTAGIAANETTMQAITYMHPLGKTGTPVNIASAIGWLLDEEQNWITGQVIGVDGGLSTVQPRLRVSSTAK